MAAVNYIYHLMFKVYGFVAGYLWVSIGRRLWPTILYAQNQFCMIMKYSAAVAEYIHHIFYFQNMFVGLTDCMIGAKHTILVWYRSCHSTQNIIFWIIFIWCLHEYRGTQNIIFLHSYSQPYPHSCSYSHYYLDSQVYKSNLQISCRIYQKFTHSRNFA